MARGSGRDDATGSRWGSAKIVKFSEILTKPLPPPFFFIEHNEQIVATVEFTQVNTQNK